MFAVVVVTQSEANGNLGGTDRPEQLGQQPIVSRLTGVKSAIAIDEEAGWSSGQLENLVRHIREMLGHIHFARDGRSIRGQVWIRKQSPRASVNGPKCC